MNGNGCIPCSQNVVTVEYIVPGSNIPVPCLNPIVYLVEKAIKVEMELGTPLATVIPAVIQEGFVSQNNNLFCCPNCSDPSGFYFLGSAQAFDDFTTTIPNWSQFTGGLECCLNYEASVTTAVLIEETLDNYNNTVIDCCATSFRSDLNKITENLQNFSELNVLGIVEISSFGERSSLGLIYDSIKKLNPYADDEYILDVFTYILNVGIFVKCDSCTILIASAANAIDAVDNIF